MDYHNFSHLLHAATFENSWKKDSKPKIKSVCCNQMIHLHSVGKSSGAE